jgi:SAM-dependent methyltransferase
LPRAIAKEILSLGKKMGVGCERPVINNQVTSQYYAELRLPMLALVRGVPQRVLEIGCAGGQTLDYLKQRGAKYTIGIECSPAAASVAKDRGVDQIVVGDIEKLETPFEPASFDLILAGHVLEHLADPWTVLRRLANLLTDDGQLVGAIPNVRHHSVVLPLLLFGKWQYQSSGLLDWTHLRFFCRDSIVNLLESTGFRLENIVPDFGRKSRLANSLSLNLFQDLLCFAYNFSARLARPNGRGFRPKSATRLTA